MTHRYPAPSRSPASSRSTDVSGNVSIATSASQQIHPYFYCAYFPISFLTIFPDRLYLAAYIHPPTAETIFPYGEPVQTSPRKRSQRAADGPTPVQASARLAPYYFSVDDTLLYNAFHHDFGPLHIGHLYRFALQFHDVLGAKENRDRPIVFWSRADPRSESQRRPDSKSIR